MITSTSRDCNVLYHEPRDPAGILHFLVENAGTATTNRDFLRFFLNPFDRSSFSIDRTFSRDRRELRLVRLSTMVCVCLYRAASRLPVGVNIAVLFDEIPVVPAACLQRRFFPRDVCHFDNTKSLSD